MKKKIIFFHLLNNYSGSPRVLADVISVTKYKYDVALITSSTDGFLSDLKIKLHLFSYGWNKNKLITLLRLIYAQLAFVFYAIKYANKNTIFYLNTMQPSIAGLIGKLLGASVVFHIHETSSSQKYFGNFYKLIRKYVNGYEIFVSKYIHQKEIINEDKSVVIYNTVSREIADVSLKSNYKHKTDDSYNVLMICSLRDYKGVPEFFELAKKFKNDNGIKFNLLVDGSISDIEKYITNKTLPDNMSIFPRTSEPERYLLDTSLLLSLSRIDEWVETFGLTILEAISFGIPCIVPPLGGPVEIIDDRINGFCISSYELDKIFMEINNLKDDENKSIEFSKQSKLKSQFFSREKFNDSILKFLEELI